MKLAVFLALGAVGVCGLFVLVALQLCYAITDHHLKVTLFGLCLRRIKLSDIDYVSKRQASWAEKWYNTLHPSHRVLVVRRRRGWFKDFVITPRNRYVFRTELECALARLQSPDNRMEPGRGRGHSAR
jgi:hypothetical protein